MSDWNDRIIEEFRANAGQVWSAHKADHRGYADDEQQTSRQIPVAPLARAS